jgi:hypothetical protein
MFGGLAFMLGGHMFCGVIKDTLMVRLGPGGAVSALDQPHVRPMDFTGRPMKASYSSSPKACTVLRCRTGSTPPQATHAACRPSSPRRLAGSAGDITRCWRASRGEWR